MSFRKNGLACAATVILALAIASPAPAAVTVTNRDDKDHKVTVIENDGASTTDHTLKPNQVLEGICPNGCVIRLNDNEEDEYELEGSEVVSIEEGYLYYDGPDGGEQTNQGTGPPTQPPPQTPPAKK
jgi:hypothetical protein